MRGNMILRVLFGLILLVGLVALGVYIYNAGIAQGIVTSGSSAAPGAENIPGPYFYPYFYRPWGFGFFGCIFPLLFIFLIFAAWRGLFFRGWRHHGYWYGDRLHDHEGRNVPPMVEEWHRKMHSGESQQPTGEE